MKNIRKEVATWIQLGSFLLIWLSLVFVFDARMQLDLEALKRFPEAVLIYSVGHLYFTRNAWRWRVFQGWLVPFPNLQGTWAGTIHTTWTAAVREAVPPDPIPVLLVIRQSFSSLTCLMYSKESTSSSGAATIDAKDGSGQPELSFIYNNQPRAIVRDRSQIHEGAAVLRVVMKPKRMLEGRYWTDRKTTGEIQVLFRSRKLVDRFSM